MRASFLGQRAVLPFLLTSDIHTYIPASTQLVNKYIIPHPYPALYTGSIILYSYKTLFLLWAAPVFWFAVEKRKKISWKKKLFRFLTGAGQSRRGRGPTATFLAVGKINWCTARPLPLGKKLGQRRSKTLAFALLTMLCSPPHYLGRSDLTISILNQYWVQPL